MIICNITIKVDWSIAKDWEKWMKDEHIAEVLQTGCFDKHQFVRLLQVDEADGPTFATQFYSPNLTNYNHYLHHYAQALRKKVAEKWGQNYVDFITLMQVLD
jgi:hypothetical protein